MAGSIIKILFLKMNRIMIYQCSHRKKNVQKADKLFMLHTKGDEEKTNSISRDT